MQVFQLDVQPIKQEVQAPGGESMIASFVLSKPASDSAAIRISFRDVERVNDEGAPTFRSDQDSASPGWVVGAETEDSRGQRQSLDLKHFESEQGTVLSFTEPVKVFVQFRLPKANATKAQYLGVFFEPGIEGTESAQLGVKHRVGSLVALTSAEAIETPRLVLHADSWHQADSSGRTLDVSLTNAGLAHLELGGQVFLQDISSDWRSSAATLNLHDQWLLPTKSFHLSLADDRQIPWWQPMRFYRLKSELVNRGQPLVREQIVFDIYLIFYIYILILLLIIFLTQFAAALGFGVKKNNP